MQAGFTKLEKGQLEIKKDISEIKDDISKLESKITKIEFLLESEIKPKIELSLEGHKTNTEQLSRIENEVSKHEEVILRRVK
ncbi:MAG: hypothetical protein H7Y18_11925 [Clostridiaceae bacterium]|nr:hypothetical protein [Clostridiaceae bacterium]